MAEIGMYYPVQTGSLLASYTRCLSFESCPVPLVTAGPEAPSREQQFCRGFWLPEPFCHTTKHWLCAENKPALKDSQVTEQPSKPTGGLGLPSYKSPWIKKIV